MIVVSGIADLREALANAPEIGLVPTMGALHDGHRALMAACRKENQTSVVSIFVNPTQFDRQEDLETYPRTLESDLEIAEAEGFDFAFAPTAKEMYSGPRCAVSVHKIGEVLEGAHRPGHFTGVTTVVTKLFNMVEPQRAYFGTKDLQQLAVVRLMVEALNFPIAICALETVREDDGLALSSRNARLTKSDRAVAPELYKAIRLAADEVASGSTIGDATDRAKATLAKFGFDVDYVEIVQPDTMCVPEEISPSDRIVAAAILGGVRLIDNVLMSAQHLDQGLSA